MLIRREQATREQIAEECIVWDYPMPSEEIGIAIQELNGRVPNSGWYLNKVCHETNYVIVGSGLLFIEEDKYNIMEKDVYIIEPNKKHYLIVDNLKILTVTIPNWYKEQCEIIE